MPSIFKSAPSHSTSGRKAGRPVGAIVLALAALAAGLASTADAIPVFATDDTTLLSLKPTENRTGWSFMQPSAGQQALMSFPIREVLPAGATQDSLERVLLMVHVVNITSPGSLEVVRVLGTFNEASNATYAARPAVAAAGTGVVFALDKGPTRPYYIDVTSLAKQALAANSATLALAIQPATSSPSASAEIWARESGTILPWTPATRPQLDVTLAAPQSQVQSIWVPSVGQASCNAMCSSNGLMAAATSSGAVCKNANGSAFGTEYSVANDPKSMVIYYHYECGSSNGYDRTAQCACSKKL